MSGLVMAHFRNRKSGHPGFYLRMIIRHIVPKIKFTIIVLLLSIGVLICFSSYSAAQNDQDYKCNANHEITKMFIDPDVFLVMCTIEKPVNEITLRSWSEQVYTEILNRKYQNIFIGWMLFLGSENDCYLSDIGSSRFENGKLKELYLPEANKKADSVEITNEFLLRLFQDVTQDGFKEGLHRQRQ